MLIMRPVPRGVTLIELVVGLVIVSVVLAVGMPSFTEWIQNAQVRSAAQSILNGLQSARNEAVRRNANVRFDFTLANGAPAWNVGCVAASTDCPASIQSKPVAEGGGNAGVGVGRTAPAADSYATVLVIGTDLPGGVTFNNMGGVANVGSDITRIDVTNSAYAAARRLVIVIGNGGLIRMCDPALSLASNPQGCE